MNTISNNLSLNKPRWIDFFFYLFIVLILLNRVLLFLQLNFDHIDSDQAIMWLGARHYSEGLFYEPRFYGQSYNTFMEALLAVPFIKLGVPIYIAVPFITYVLFLTPFLFSSIYLYNQDKKPQALLVLIILLCLPTGYDIMNSIPRGFVTGIFFTTPFILSIHQPTKLLYVFISTLCAGIAYLVNQNSLLVSIPVLFFLFLSNYSSKKYYLYSAFALVLTLPLAYLLDNFYRVHPEYVQHGFKNEFSVSYFISAIQHLDERFANINFFVDRKCIFLLLTLLISSIILFKSHKKAFYTFVLFLLFIFVTFFSSKIADGVAWPYYSYSRMYLGIPLVLYLLLSLVSFKNTKIIASLISITLLFSAIKLFNLKKDIAHHTDIKNWHLIHPSSLENTLQLGAHYKKVCHENGVKDLVIVNDIWCKEELGYSMPALDKEFPNTLLTVGEKRAWRIAEEKARKLNRFVMLNDDYDFDKRGYDTLYNFKIKRLDYYGCFLIEENKMPLTDLLNSIGSPVNGIKPGN